MTLAWFSQNSWSGFKTACPMSPPGTSCPPRDILGAASKPLLSDSLPRSLRLQRHTGTPQGQVLGLQRSTEVRGGWILKLSRPLFSAHSWENEAQRWAWLASNCCVQLFIHIHEEPGTKKWGHLGNQPAWVLKFKLHVGQLLNGPVPQFLTYQMGLEGSGGD